MTDTSKYKDKRNPPFKNGEWVIATHPVTSNPHCGFKYGKLYRAKCEWKEWYNEHHKCWVRMWYVGVIGFKDGACYYAPYLFSSANMGCKEIPTSSLINGSIVIPEITDPLGKHWEQPLRQEILLTERYAVMTSENRALLKKYDASFPTGVYIGKMFERRGDLVWFGECHDEKFVNNNYREIIERPKQFIN